MAIKIVTDFRILLYKARALGHAEKKGDAVEIAAAQKDHDAYRELCLNADSMTIGGLRHVA